MNKISFLSAAAIVALAASQPAHAQINSSPSGTMQQPAIQPKSPGDQTLPPAVPGAGNQTLNTAPSVVKPQTGNPTTELFTAINGNDYNSAQDAISRGADLNAQNTLGETPIDLSVGLNRNSITFLLLAARNDSGGGSESSSPMPAIPATTYSAAKKSKTVAVKLIETPGPSQINNPGTPNPSAGFLGFGK
jgi:hypothetical protein